MGLDEVQREYIARKQELDDAIPDVKMVIEEEGLHKQYMQKDYWSRLDSGAEELERKQLIAELQKKKNKTRTSHNAQKEEVLMNTRQISWKTTLMRMIIQTSNPKIISTVKSKVKK